MTGGGRDKGSRHHPHPARHFIVIDCSRYIHVIHVVCHRHIAPKAIRSEMGGHRRNLCIHTETQNIQTHVRHSLAGRGGETSVSVSDRDNKRDTSRIVGVEQAAR